jgi:hypothetical protein
MIYTKEFLILDDAKSNIMLDICTLWGEPEVGLIQIMAATMNDHVLYCGLN